MRLSALGLIGGALLASAVNVASVSAQSASISGSTTFITPAGFTSTVSAESVLPSGFFFNTNAAALSTPAIPPITITTVTGPTTTTTTTPAIPVGNGFPPTVPNVPLGLSNAQVIVVPSYNVLGFSVATTSLSIGSSQSPTATATSASSFTAAAATILTNAAAAVPGAGPGGTAITTVGINAVYNSANIDFIAAIISAGAGVSGLD